MLSMDDLALLWVVGGFEYEYLRKVQEREDYQLFERYMTSLADISCGNEKNEGVIDWETCSSSWFLPLLKVIVKFRFHIDLVNTINYLLLLTKLEVVLSGSKLKHKS